MDLFDQQVIPVGLTDERKSEIIFWPNWLDGQQADKLLATAITKTPWREDMINIAGRRIPVPRLQNWFGAPDTSYTYSGIRLQAQAFPIWMDSVRVAVEQVTGHPFNRALVNYYRHGRDSVDWHADDEPELGVEPLVASLSLGAERVFQLRHNQTKERLSVSLPHGSLLLMGAGIQDYWQHRLAKVSGLEQPRVNFTFRYMEK
ncbi:alpha-ketoglutarate-dependent dioxygenase AlkB [bacterium]|nr:alpha-ketoglutarate-dependent dioxygenase AlkB [Porticoccaceae bacterium]MDB4032589.1 alpha-ketoglutarate-dependent dioxygenase AlkB [Porticoccaceae bacterium]MDB4077331.1 alpha-ketoglutarate-dependent dioxygenase AlkB [Porticoccaceae bacterium]MDB4322033.1 alpha-ketoglutarate-dependent dioxygenase AlkB [bacterium]MDB9999361.1 alpha-ketoglutarate-dependent dioxygenase AlkB [Porticoccaceae bacterium]